MNQSFRRFLTAVVVILTGYLQSLHAQDPLSPEDLLGLKYCSGLQVSPDGSHAIYAVYTPRGPNESPGGAHAKYWVKDLDNGESRPLFQEEIKASSPRWSPDGRHIGVIHSINGMPRQVWVMPADGGSLVQLTHSATSVSYFRWNPQGRGLAYLARTPDTDREKELKKRGYDFIYYEENLKNNNLFVTYFDQDWNETGTDQMAEGKHIWDFVFNARGNKLAVSSSPENLIDHRYMFRRIFLIDLQSGDMEKISDNEGKLGNYAFSPNGSHLAYCAALNLNDHAVSQAFVVAVDGGEVRNLTPDNFRGHISWIAWKDNRELLCYSGEGVYPKLSLIDVNDGQREIILDSEEAGFIFSTPEFTADFEHFVFTGTTPYDYYNVYFWDGKKDPVRLTDLNPVLAERSLGEQEVIRYAARDGMEIEGLLIKPPDYDPAQTWPLVVYVHGGPESHHSNGWLSRYATPGQVMAGKGYLVLYLNYRASTGYGVDFGMEGFMDPAGKEFDDIADAIDYLVKEKSADRDRVGMAGGSYGGYASGWFATYYTEYVRAVCMFVGVSNVVSRRGTTDIPYEELYVHSGEKLEEQWQMNLERSPVYWAHQSKTATLIYGGAADTRVPPSQSLELYRRMKMNDHPAVRLVQYPGEGHGNRNQVGRMDVLYRQIQWLDWYVRDSKPIDGPMPPLDISDSYGLDWEF